MNWQLAEAKNKLSEVVTRAIDEGPQRITRRKDVVFVVSEAEYLRLRGLPPEKPDFIEFLLSGPKLTDNEIALFERIRIEPRNLDE